MSLYPSHPFAFQFLISFLLSFSFFLISFSLFHYFPFSFILFSSRFLQDFFECLIGTIQVILVISISLPVMLLCMAPVVFYFWFISRQYLKVSRDLKRLESVNKSPVYVLFSGRSKRERARERERKRA